MSVRWRRLTLRGFGRFAAPVNVEFHRGLNVLIAPNERGKSTLLAGLAAVLFGLPAVSNPAVFGQGKWRHWGDAARFEGELEFSRGERVYRVRRQFADHRVTVSEQTETGWRDIWSGEHNPKARRRHLRYERFLLDAVGIDNVDVFWSAFAFGSPLPEAGELDHHIQQLLSGAGAAHYMTALERLQKAAFALTKHSKAIGVADQDRRRNGELERVQAEEAELAARIEASRAAVDEREHVQRRLDELRRERDRAQTERRRAEGTLAAWTEWAKTRDERRRALDEQSKALQAWERYNELTRRMEEHEMRIRSEYPEFADDDGTVGARLERLSELEAEATARRAAVRARVEGIVARAAEKAAAWRRFVGSRQRLAATDARLADEFGVFERADAGTLALYARFESEKERLRRQVERAEEEVAAAAARAAARERFMAAYGDLQGVEDDEAAEAIAQRRSALARRDELLARQRALFAAETASDAGSTASAGSASGAKAAGSLGTGPLLGGGIAAAVLAAVAFFVGGPWAAGIVVAVAAAAGFVVVLQRRRREEAAKAEAAAARRQEAEELAEALAAVEAELAPDPRLGPFAEADAHELGVLSQRLAARREAAAALPAEQKSPSERAAAALGEAREAADRFWRQVAPGVAAFGEGGLAEAFQTWQALRAERDRLRRELEQWIAERFGQVGLHPESTPLLQSSAADGVEPAGDGGVDGLPGGTRGTAEADGLGPGAVWRALARIVAAVDEGAGSGTVTVGDVVDKLSAWQGEAAAAVVDAVAAQEEDDPLERERAALQEELAGPLNAAQGDVAAARTRWQRFQQQMRLKEEWSAQRAGLLAGQGVADADELHVRSVDFGNRAEAARRQMERLREAHPELPDADGEDDGEGLGDRLRRLQAAVDTAKGEEERLDAAFRELLHREAALSGAAVINIAAAEEDLARLRRRRRELEFEVEATALAYRELAQAVETYEGTHRDVLAARANRYLERFTGRARRVVLDEQFRVKIQDPDGPLHDVGQLSQGAQDQLYLALRLAIADLAAAEAPLPLLLDDPFVHCDEGRLARIREALVSLEPTRQIVLLSHRDDFAPWGGRIEPEGEGWDVS